jgi:hypothetical protein
LRGALDALTQQNVATRAQHFSVSMRDLSDHMLKQLAPDDEAIQACAWYDQHADLDGPTRRQRALYASRGGLTDAFLKTGLKLNPKEFHAEIVPHSPSSTNAPISSLTRSSPIRPRSKISRAIRTERRAQNYRTAAELGLKGKASRIDPERSHLPAGEFVSHLPIFRRYPRSATCLARS